MDPFKILLRIYGEDFLAYVLALEPGVDLRTHQLNQGRQEVFNFLLAQATSIPDDTSGFETLHNLAGLGTYVPNADTSLVNLLRTTAGGSLAEIKVDADEDIVLANLMVLARDVWPIYLLPVPDEGPKTFWVSTPLGIFQHPKLPDLAKAMIADKVLTKLFPSTPSDVDSIASLDDIIKYQSMIVSTSGRGGGLQLVTSVGSIISDAVFRSLIGQEKLSWTTLEEQLAKTLAAVRTLASGKSASLPALVGVSGLRLGSGVSLSIAGGVLRNATTPERELLMPKGETVSAVFETSYPTKVFASPTVEGGMDDFEKRWARVRPQMEEAQRSFQHAVNMLRLALLLASSPRQPLLMNEVSRFVTDPLQPGGSSSWGLSQFGIESHELTAAKVDDVHEWYETVRTKHHHSLDIGVRRLLSATTSRVDPLDAFVDAVICWENMFGAKTETTFRVTASIAKLIGNVDPAKRIDLQNELKKLYAKRSSLVHGGKEPSAREIGEYRARSIEIATDCFRVLYRDRPDLLVLESEARGAQLLLE